jgi:hypothetical protein
MRFASAGQGRLDRNASEYGAVCTAAKDAVRRNDRAWPRTRFVRGCVACADRCPVGTRWPLQLRPHRKKPKEIIRLNLGEAIAEATVHCFLRSRTCLQ